MDHTIASDQQFRRDQLLREQLSEQNRDLREAHIKSLHEMEELKRFQGQSKALGGAGEVESSHDKRLVHNW